jgi:hypothetical protein
VAAIRSGFPYTLMAQNSRLPLAGQPIVNNRANILQPANTAAEGRAKGGKVLLNRAAFGNPADGTLGNSGRNAFRGPGLVSLDIALSRSFAVARLGEGGRITLRADAFNVLNHANLNNPVASVLESDFGTAYYGRVGTRAAFPAQAPFDETARAVQLLLRVEF